MEKSSIVNLENTKVIMEILYYLIFSIVAIFTYINAKKTVFNPFKNEVFKKQIDEITILYEFFKIKQIDFLYEFGIKETLFYNVIFLLDEYTIFKKWEIVKKEDRPYNKFCKSMRMSLKYAEKNLKKPLEKKELTKEEITKERNWKEYSHECIYISEKTNKKIEELDRFIKSPFIPTELRKKLEELVQEIRNIESEIGIILTEISKEIPSNIESFTQLKEEGIEWISNSWNEKKSDKLENKVEEILELIRKYLLTDQIFVK